MLWFNLSPKQIQAFLFGFQYILCCGSTECKFWKHGWTSNFNTSYVVVQLNYNVIKIRINNNFNTSYVVVQL